MKDFLMNTFQKVQETIQQELQTIQGYPLPSFLQTGLLIFNRAHIYYRTFKFVQMDQKAAQDPSKGHPAVYGAAIQLAGDYSKTVKFATTLLLVIKCAQDLLREYQQLDENYQKLCANVKWEYPIYQTVQWKEETKETQNILSPSFSLSWYVQRLNYVEQMRRITRCSGEVFWQMFTVSMCLCDAYLLFNDDPQIRYEACTELVAKWEDYVNELAEDGELLAEEIKKESEFADRILAQLGVDIDSAYLITQLTELSKGVGGDLCEVAAETAETLFVSGKVTPFHINLEEGSTAAPALPAGRFPPWGGQSVSDSSPLSPKPSSTSSKSTSKLLDHPILSKISIPGFSKESLRGAAIVTQTILSIFKQT
jgi:hypothetical protein